jgi:TP901 family phage tail tape measure protein
MPKVISFTLEVNGIEKEISNQKQLTEALKQTNEAFKGAKFGTIEYEKLEKQTAALKNAQKDLQAQSRATGQQIAADAEKGTGSYRELSATLSVLKNKFKDLSEVDRNSPIGAAFLKDINLVDGKLKTIDASFGTYGRNVGNYKTAILEAFSQINPSIGQAAENFSGLADGGARLAGTAAILGGIAVAAVALAKSIQINAQISDLKADVVKTVGLTANEIDRLTESLKGLDTRTSIDGLLKIATIGGQLGVTGESNILKFTSAIDKLNVALGDEFQGGAAEITDQIGRLSNVLFGQESNGDKLAKNLLNIGNALNVLSQSGAATSPVISDFANRIGGVGKSLGLTTGQILGLSTTLQELNVNAERGGTAINRLLTSISGDRKNVAKVLGLDLKEFSNLLNTDLNAALNLVIGKVGQLGKSNTDLSDILKTLKIDGQGELEVFLKLSQNQQLLAERTRIATEALKGQDSITNEFNVKNNTLAGSLEKLSNAITNGFVNSGFEKAFKGLIDVLIPLTEGFFALAGGILKVFGTITGIIPLYEYLNRETNKSVEANNKLSKTIQSVNEQQATGQKIIKDSFAILKNEKSTLEEKKKAIEQLQKLSPQSVKDYQLEGKTAAELTEIQKRLTAEYKEQGKVKLLKDAAILVSDFQAARTELGKLIKQRDEAVKSSGGNGGRIAADLNNRVIAAQNNVNDLAKVVKRANDEIDNFDKASEKANIIEPKTTIGGGSANLGKDTKVKKAFDIEAEILKINADAAKAQLKFTKDSERAKADAIKDEQTRELQNEKARFEERLNIIGSEGQQLEDEARKRAENLLRDGDISRQQANDLIKLAVEKRATIEKQGNDLIELETDEHQRRIQSINEKYAALDQKAIEKQQSDNLEKLKLSLEGQFTEIERATNEGAIKIQDLRDKLDLSEISDSEKGKISLKINVQDDENNIEGITRKLNTLKTALQSVLDVNNALALSGQQPFINDKGVADLQKQIESTQKNLTDAERKASKDRLAITKDELKDKEKRQKEHEKNLEQVRDGVFDLADKAIAASFKSRDDQQRTELANQTAALEKFYATRIEQAKGNADEEKALRRELEDKKDALSKEFAEKGKKRALAQLGIETALAIVKALSTLGPITGGIASAFILATSAIQAANISKQKFQRGGKVGIAGGNLHSQGGTQYIGSDGNRFEVERDEVMVVINRHNSKRLRGASILNSLDGYGDRFERGGVISSAPAFLFNSVAQKQKTNSSQSVSLSLSKNDLKQISYAVGVGSKTGSESGTASGIRSSNSEIARRNRAINKSLI